MHTRQAKLAYWIFFLLPVLSGLWACAPVPEAEPTPRPVVPTAVTVSAPSTATPMLPACYTRPGRVLTVLLDSTSIPQFQLYLPPCYEKMSPQRFPVLYLFHGQSYKDDQWLRLGVASSADRLIAAGETAPFIIVMPYDKASWRNPEDDLFDQAVLSALIPYVDTHYRTLANPQHRTAGGLSRGAGWALRLGLTRPDLFGAIGAHSPVVFYADQSRLSSWLANLPADTQPAIYVDVGQSDRERGTALQLVSLLDTYQIPHVWSLHDGSHDEAYWREHVEDYLRWYAAKWGN